MMHLTAALWIGSALFVIAAIVMSGVLVIRSHADWAFEVCNQIENDFKRTKIDDIKETLVLQMEMKKQYHKDALFRANLSFIFGLVFAGIGILLFFSIIIFMVFGLSNNITITVVGGVAGALVQVLAGINFYLYNRASGQLQIFHTSLDRLQNYMLAISICQGLDGAECALTRAHLSLIIASSSVSENEGRVIGEIIKQQAFLSPKQQLLTTATIAQDGHSDHTQA